MKSKEKNYAIVIVIVLCLIAMLPNFCQFQVAAYGADIMNGMGLTPSQFSSVTTAPMLAGFLLSIISGLLSDKFGSRLVLTVGCGLTMLAVVLRIFSDSFASLYVIMIFIGVCGTCSNTNCGKIFGQWLPKDKIPIAMGAFLAMANAGTALGTGTATLFNGMHGAFIGSAVLSVIIFLITLLFLREKKDDREEKAKVDHSGILASIKIALSSKTVWLAAVALMLSTASLMGMSSFLPAAMAERGITGADANIISMSLTLGALVSSFLSPLIARMFKKRITFFVLFAAISAVGTAFAWRASASVPVLVILMLITGFFSGGFAPFIIALPVQDPKVGTRCAGTAGGVVTTLQLGGSVIIPSYIVAPLATTAMGTANYKLMFILFAIVKLIFIGVAFLLPNFTEKGAD